MNTLVKIHWLTLQFPVLKKYIILCLQNNNMEDLYELLLQLEHEDDCVVH